MRSQDVSTRSPADVNAHNLPSLREIFTEGLPQLLRWLQCNRCDVRFQSYDITNLCGRCYSASVSGLRSHAVVDASATTSWPPQLPPPWFRSVAAPESTPTWSPPPSPSAKSESTASESSGTPSSRQSSMDPRAHFRYHRGTSQPRIQRAKDIKNESKTLQEQRSRLALNTSYQNGEDLVYHIAGADLSTRQSVNNARSSGLEFPKQLSAEALIAIAAKLMNRDRVQAIEEDREEEFFAEMRDLIDRNHGDPLKGTLAEFDHVQHCAPDANGKPCVCKRNTAGHYEGDKAGLKFLDYRCRRISIGKAMQTNIRRLKAKRRRMQTGK